MCYALLSPFYFFLLLAYSCHLLLIGQWQKETCNLKNWKCSEVKGVILSQKCFCTWCTGALLQACCFQESHLPTFSRYLSFRQCPFDLKRRQETYFLSVNRAAEQEATAGVVDDMPTGNGFPWFEIFLGAPKKRMYCLFPCGNLASNPPLIIAM